MKITKQMIMEFVDSIEAETVNAAFDDVFNAGKNIVLYGAGAVGGYFLHHLKNAGYAVSFFCDSNPAKIGKSYMGIPIISLSELRLMKDEVTVFITTGATLEVARSLKNAGIEDYKILSVYVLDLRPYTAEYISNLRTNIGELLNLIDDEKSLTVLLAVLKMYLLLQVDEDLVFALVEGNQYFADGIVNIGKESFVDCGAYDGDTLQLFLQKAGGNFAEYYAIEPLPASYEKLCQTIRTLNDDRIKPMNLAVSDSDDDVILMSNADDMGSSIVWGESDGTLVECRKLDTLLAHKSVSFIKADIEGAETSMLRGAEQTIRSQSPTCAICVYHKLTDMWEVPFLLKKYNSDYKIYFRAYTAMLYEIICYAIPSEVC
jgi:FkbM family methyltransferase